MLQTSSNQRNSHRLTRTPVTNVVNPSPKTAIISEKALRLTTFVTTDQKCAQKTPRIDDVCNNMHQSTPKNSTRETPVTPTGSRGTGPRCRRAVAGPGWASSRRTSTRQHTNPHWCGGHRRVRRAWLQCSWAAEGPGWASSRRTSTRQHTNPHWCGGHRRVRRARLRHPRAVAGLGRASRRRAKPHISDQASLVWRAPEGPEGQAATPVGSVGAWSRCRWVAAGPGRASRSTTPSRQARVWRSRGRAAAHRHSKRPGTQVRQA